MNDPRHHHPARRQHLLERQLQRCARSRRERARRAPLLSVAALLALAGSGCGDVPLSFSVRPIPVAHDGPALHDVVPVDLDHDGDTDLVACTATGFRYLRYEGAAWLDETAGTGLDGISPADAMLADGDDLIVLRGHTASRLAYTGIGSWEEVPEAVTAPLLERPLSVVADFDGNGTEDEAQIEGRHVSIRLRTAAGLRPASRDLGLASIRLQQDGRALFARDLDGDGDTDLLALGGRMLALINNGGRWTPHADAHFGSTSLAANPLASTTGAPASGSIALPAMAQAVMAQDEPDTTPWFTDVADAAGVAFTHIEGEDQWDIRPTMGPGVAWADVDSDGDEDLYVVGGAGQTGRLFVNDGTGSFTDRTVAWKLAGEPGAGMGASFCDWDDDGDPDLYVTRQGPNVMWRHDGDHYTDVSKASGTDDARWGAGVAWADVDGDADLDLFVTNYLEFDLALIPPESDAPRRRREDPIAMLPYVFPGQTNVLYRNEGDGTFTDITEKAGLAAPDGKSLGALVFDEDGDGHTDIYVANDTTPNTLWRNHGDGRFEEVALFVGLDDPRGGMGLAATDMDRDGDEDLLATYWQLEPNGVYRSNAVHPPTQRRFIPRFEDVAVKCGLAQASVGVVGWGIVWDDLDNDGDDDLLVANGYTSPDYDTTMRCVGQPDHLFENVTAGPLREWSDVPTWRLVDSGRAGPWFANAYAGRGMAAADIDGDGDLDVVVTANNGPLALLRNERGGRSLRVVPVGNGKSVSREAVGARVTLSLDDGRSITRVVRRGSSYLSGHERGVRFGLGSGAPARLLIRWPDGTETSLPTEDLPASGRLEVTH